MMIDRDKILKRASGSDDRMLLSKLIDKAVRAEITNKVFNSDFLDPYQRALIEKAFSGIRDVIIEFYGGFDGAERTVAFFSSPGFTYDDNEALDETLYQSCFKVLNAKTGRHEKLTHRDYLGALMSLGIKREKIGDILVENDGCNIVVLEEIADFLSYNLTQAGKAKLDISVKDIGELELPELATKEINTTVASLRLDSIVGSGFGISRSKAADYVRAEKVNLNWETVTSPDRHVSEGDTISLRGKGRIVIETVGGNTRKGRTGILIRRLI